MKVATTRPLPEAGIDLLYDAYDVELFDPDPDEEVDEERLIHLARGADALVTTVADPVTARVLEASAHLTIVAQYGVGTDNIDLEAARALGIVVTNTPGVLSDATADLAFALLLAVARRIPQADQFVRDGRFKRWETMLLLGTSLTGKTMGIVGMGRIGAAMARRARGFGMDILYYNRTRANPTSERLLGAEYASFDALVERSDVISLHCALNDDSYHLFDAGVFERMKPTSLLINTARGPVVDEAALVAALDAGEIAGAGLDVFEHEPDVHPGLLEHERVVLAPHLGSATVETRTEMARMCSRSVQAALSGEEKIPYRVV